MFLGMLLGSRLLAYTRLQPGSVTRYLMHGLHQSDRLPSPGRSKHQMRGGPRGPGHDALHRGVLLRSTARCCRSKQYRLSVNSTSNFISLLNSNLKRRRNAALLFAAGDVHRVFHVGRATGGPAALSPLGEAQRHAVQLHPVHVSEVEQEVKSLGIRVHLQGRAEETPGENSTHTHTHTQARGPEPDLQGTDTQRITRELKKGSVPALGSSVDGFTSQLKNIASTSSQIKYVD
ncbi:hypothetical protein EYF80_013357 [Liparis tanakae]|uniref:Uncharacterized protein n=1 Tax=Liparis tanakae TaxID=230148 RepID=A0A4Z2IGP4_9TELE|nr:hypothetical protein EYF80_013357 [Liparis tanakae]